MNPISRGMIISILIVGAAAASFIAPRAKYESVDVLSRLDVPERFYYWVSRDRSTDFNPNDMRYNFISKVFAREYRSKYAERLTLLMLDAGNFHNPRVCYGACGYSSIDLPKASYDLEGLKLEAEAVFFEKPKGSFVSVYWITVDKERVDWTRQKILQLWHSVTGRKKAGLMVRIDIPSNRQDIADAIKVSGEFLSHLYTELPPEQRDYIFGR